VLKRFLEKPATKQLIMMNVEFGIPYDLANTLTNPLGKTLTVVSVIGVSIFLALGLVLIPYNTIVDILDPDGLFPGALLFQRRKKRSLSEKARPSFGYFPSLLEIEDAFSLFDERDGNCRKRLICDFHSIFSQLPNFFHKLIRVFTRQLQLKSYKEAALLGLSGSDCSEVFKKCNKSNMQILGQIFPNYTGGRRFFGRDKTT